MENLKNPNRKKKQKFPRWLTLSLFSNCFGEGDKFSHLGICFRGVYYCITHSSGNGIIVPKNMLKMAKMSNNEEYFKRCLNIPKVLHRTKMKINESFIVNAILSSELNMAK